MEFHFFITTPKTVCAGIMISQTVMYIDLISIEFRLEWVL